MVLEDVNGAVFLNTTPLYNPANTVLLANTTDTAVDSAVTVPYIQVPEYDGVMFSNTTTTVADGVDVLVVVDELLALTCLPQDEWSCRHVSSYLVEYRLETIYFESLFPGDIVSPKE